MGLNTPLSTRPKSDLIADWFLKHYYRLSISRTSNGYGPNPISITEIVSYFNIVAPVLDPYLTMVIFQDMDTIYFENFRDSQTQKQSIKDKEPIK